jgi:hypothetical protein
VDRSGGQATGPQTEGGGQVRYRQNVGMLILQGASARSILNERFDARRPKENIDPNRT